MKSGRATKPNSRPSRRVYTRYMDTSAGMSTSSTTAAITIAESVASGRSSNSPVSAIRVMIVSAATTSPESWLRAPADALTAVLDMLPLTTIPLESAAPRFAAVEPEQLTVDVDLLVLTGGVGLGGPEALGKADEHHSDPARGQRAEVLDVDVGNSKRRQPALDRSDDLDPVVVEVKQLHGEDPEQHGDQRPGNGRREPA